MNIVIASANASTLAKPHMPTQKPKLSQRACNANATKRKIELIESKPSVHNKVSYVIGQIVVN